PFPFVDAGGEVLVDVVAKDVAVQERTSAVRFHAELDGGFFLRLAAENFGDDALHLAAVAFVDERAAPGDQGVAPDDQAGQPGQAAADQLPLLNRFAVRFAEFAPGNHAPHHQAHCAGGVGTEGNAAEIEAVVGDGQA